MESPGTPPRAYRIITSLNGLVVRIFFREVEVSGLGHVPERGGGVIVSWHPNGLIDPILILTQFPRQVVFGARHGLFKFPLLGFLFRRIGTVPIYRAQDAKSSRVGSGDHRVLDPFVEVGHAEFLSFAAEHHDRPIEPTLAGRWSHRSPLKLHCQVAASSQIRYSFVTSRQRPARGVQGANH